MMKGISSGGWRGTLWTEMCQWFGTVPERESLLRARALKVLIRVEGSILKHGMCDYQLRWCMYSDGLAGIDHPGMIS